MSYKEPKFPFLRAIWKKALIIAGSLTIIYFLAVIAGAVAIYKYKIWNQWTHDVAQIFPYPAAVANNDVILLADYRREVAARNYFAKHTNLDVTDEAIRQEVIDQLITRSLFEQELQKSGTYINNRQVEEKVEEVIAAAGGKENVIQFLKENYGPGITLKNFEYWTERLLVESAIQHELLTQATVRHILITTHQKADKKTVEAAKEKASQIKARIKDPAKFSDVAKEFSEDVASRDNGGLQGEASRGEIKERFSPEYEEAVFTGELNTVLGPIRSSYGWHIILVEERTGEIDKSLSEYTKELKEKSATESFINY